MGNTTIGSLGTKRWGLIQLTCDKTCPTTKRRNEGEDKLAADSRVH